MARSAFLASSVIVLVAMMVGGSYAESHHELCLGKRVNFTEIEFVALGECVKEYAPPPALAEGVTESSDSIRDRIKTAKDHKCMEPCFMVHKKMFIDGKFNMKNSEGFIKEFPTEVQKDLTESLTKCAKLVDGKTLNLDNKTCADFQEFIKCVDDDENKICKREE